MKELRILLVGGGSGGHVYPLIAVAESLKRNASLSDLDLKLMMIGGSFIQRAAMEADMPFRVISTGKLRRYSSTDNFLDVGRFLIGFVQSLWHIFWFMPDAVFAKGGAASIAPAIVAKLYFIPLFIHESDSVPGLANKLIGKIATAVFLSFKNAEKGFEGVENIIFTGGPVRKKLSLGNKNTARDFFDLHNERPTLFFIGGSQGAKAINDIVLASLVMLTTKYNIIHQCGDSQYQAVKSSVDTILKEGTAHYSDPIQKYYRYYPFFEKDKLALAYRLSDIVIARAGSSTLFEISESGKPAIIVPIDQSVSNHQYFNAFEFSHYGGYLMEESTLNRDSLTREITEILKPENYIIISEKIKGFATPDAADKIAEYILSHLL